MPSLPPEIQLHRLANAYQLSRALQVAARLGLGRLLADGPLTLEAIARDTATHAPTLARFLRFLAEIGIVSELPDGRFAATPLSESLHLIDNIAQGDEAWAVWGALPDALATGRPTFSRVHGQAFYDYAAAHPVQEANWQEWNLRQIVTFASVLADSLRLGDGEIVVDVGGGEGALLAALLSRYPECRGVLLDLPSVVRRAPQLLRQAEVDDRCTVVAGDALRDVPRGGDLYLLCRVLFNWDDGEATRLLRNCRRAMKPGSRLVVVETLVSSSGDPRRRAPASADLHHFLLWGGRLRSQNEMEALFVEAGLDPHDHLPAGADGWTLLEALPSEKKERGAARTV